MTPGLVGAVLGLSAGLGGCLTLRRLPWLSRVTLDDRLAPYLRDTALPSTLLATRTAVAASGRVRGTSAAMTWWHARALPELARRLELGTGGSASVRARVDQLGTGSVEQVRLDQLVWGAGALGSVLATGLAAAAAGSAVPPVVLALLCLLAGLAGVLARDRALSRAVSRRRARILVEFPTVAELLALSVAAGEGPAGALERVSTVCTGELGRELARTLADARAGANIVQALQQLADRAGLPVLRRFVDGMIVAVERGSPLAEVLRAQAIDVREAGRQALIETAARREIAMMAPVVFLVLPVSVVFALFPGFWGLRLNA